jgi:predicted alpha/beta-fold hydrolase
MDHICRKYPNHTLYGVGISMGANLLLKYSGEKKNENPFKAIISLNNPFDIWLAINLMRGKIYE